MLIRVYDGRYDSYKLLYNDMANTVYNEYATFYFNDDKGVHHKTGDYDGYYNDIVIVEGKILLYLQFILIILIVQLKRFRI